MPLLDAFTGKVIQHGQRLHWKAKSVSLRAGVFPGRSPVLGKLMLTTEKDAASLCFKRELQSLGNRLPMTTRRPHARPRKTWSWEIHQSSIPHLTRSPLSNFLLLPESHA